MGQSVSTYHRYPGGALASDMQPYTVSWSTQPRHNFQRGGPLVPCIPRPSPLVPDPPWLHMVLSLPALFAWVLSHFSIDMVSDDLAGKSLTQLSSLFSFLQAEEKARF